MPEEIPLGGLLVESVQSSDEDGLRSFFGRGASVTLSAGRHTLDVQPPVHSTAFLRWSFRSCTANARVRLKVIYSEGYEREPRLYPWLRTKDDRRDLTGLLIGPCDEIVLDTVDGRDSVYEPFWFRTFGVMRWTIEVEKGSVELVDFTATQVNYPLEVKASWDDPEESEAQQIFDVSVRTMRNCMFDGYADCPFYEQLQ